jgi:2-polyprenyl-3-methyl-5-hydroxy-6-metoxy-1,4-benzoquinol methylase
MNEAEIYQRGLEKYGESPQALHWVDYGSMAMRFKYLVKDLDIEGRRILDAGCGMGDLLPFLYTKADDFDYLGVDMNEGFINIAKKRYEPHRFAVGNPFDGKFKGNFDIVISSGVMNINVENWQTHRKTMIKNMFKLSRRTLAFNMAGGFKPARSDSLIAYADAADILEFCKSLTPKVSLKADYLPQDFTIVMHR